MLTLLNAYVSCCSRRAGALTPAIYLVDKDSNSIYMEKIVGDSVKNIIRSTANIGTTYTPVETTMPNRASMLAQIDASLPRSIGRAVALMHDAEVVHGDLTTSNMMVRRDDAQLVLIDFGLGSMKPNVEVCDAFRTSLCNPHKKQSSGESRGPLRTRKSLQFHPSKH